MSETLPWFLLWRKTLDFHRKSFAGNHSSKDFPSPFDVRNYFFDAIISNQYWIKTLKTDSKFFMTFYFLKKVDRDMFWPHLFFQQYIPLKIFIFRIDGRENIIGQTIHWKAKRCLVRFADVLPRHGSQLELELEETRSTLNLGGGVDSRPPHLDLIHLLAFIPNKQESAIDCNFSTHQDWHPFYNNQSTTSTLYRPKIWQFSGTSSPLPNDSWWRSHPRSSFYARLRWVGWWCSITGRTLTVTSNVMYRSPYACPLCAGYGII